MSKKKKYELENLIKTSSIVLYKMIATADGLSEWFADSVNTNKENVFTFIWEGEEEQARLLSKKQGESICFQWIDDENSKLDTYFELRISPVPSDPKMTLLTVTDFAEDDETEEAIMYWENQLTELKRMLGS